MNVNKDEEYRLKEIKYHVEKIINDTKDYKKDYFDHGKGFTQEFIWAEEDTSFFSDPELTKEVFRGVCQELEIKDTETRENVFLDWYIHMNPKDWGSLAEGLSIDLRHPRMEKKFNITKCKNAECELSHEEGEEIQRVFQELIDDPEQKDTVEFLIHMFFGRDVKMEEEKERKIEEMTFDEELDRDLEICLHDEDCDAFLERVSKIKLPPLDWVYEVSGTPDNLVFTKVPINKIKKGIIAKIWQRISDFFCK